MVLLLFNKRKKKHLKEVILQPQSDLHFVRHFLMEQGFIIVQEDMVEEAGKFYPCMKAVWKENGQSAYTEIEEWYGPLLLAEKHPVLYRYLLKEKDTFEQIAEEIRKNAKTESLENTKEETIQNRLRQIGMALAYFKN